MQPRIKVSKVNDQSKTDARIYDVSIGGKFIGRITGWESYVWDIDSEYVSPLASSYRTRKGAVARMVADYHNHK